MREVLKNLVEHESQLKKISLRLEQCTPDEGMCFVLLQWIPCILHMENRVGLKILTMLLSEGLEIAKEGKKHPLYMQSLVKEREEAFVKNIQNVINNKILGEGLNKWQFTVPIEKGRDGEGSIIGKINLENTKTREVVENIEQLIDFCLPSDNDEAIYHREKWLTVVHHYVSSMNIVQKKDGEYTNKELKQYEKDAAIFGNLWIDLHQEKGMTNYIHMIVAGHILEYMKEWRNLYRYSQQGWESLNLLIKQFFFLCTNKGGGKNTSRSRLIPIARLFQRRLLWLSGLAEKFLNTEKLLLRSSKTIANTTRKTWKMC